MLNLTGYQRPKDLTDKEKQNELSSSLGLDGLWGQLGLSDPFELVWPSMSTLALPDLPSLPSITEIPSLSSPEVPDTPSLPSLLSPSPDTSVLTPDVLTTTDPIDIPDTLAEGILSDEVNEVLDGALPTIFDRGTPATPISPTNLNDIKSGQANGAGFVMYGEAPSDYAGFGLGAGGDINGDGYTDLVMGAHFANTENGERSGKIYVVLGNSGTDSFNLGDVSALSKGIPLIGEEPLSFVGSRISLVGDVNGDGLDDFALLSSGGSDRTYVVFGAEDLSTINLADVASGVGGFALDKGTAISTTEVMALGDVNGDGLDDFAVGAGNANSSAGRTYVVFGKRDTTLTDLDSAVAGDGGFAIEGVAPGDLSGFTLGAGGDINGDGFADILVGSPNYRTDGQGTGARGAGFVVFGKADSASVQLSDVVNGQGGFVVQSADQPGSAGRGLMSVGDFNGDGLSDFMIDYSQSVGGTGGLYLVHGKTDTIQVVLTDLDRGVGGFAFIPEENSGRTNGWDIDTIGDINGDGLADVVFSSPYTTNEDSGNTDSGRIYVVYGRQGNEKIDLSEVHQGIGGFVFENDGQTDYAGHSVAFTGDTNGDGLNELAFSVPYADTENGVNAGLNYLLFGATDQAIEHTNLDYFGSEDDDVFAATESGQVLFGNKGNDTLTAFASTILNGAFGNDTLIIDAAMVTALMNPFKSGGNTELLARVDGGSGVDTLALNGDGIHLDLTQVTNVAAGHQNASSRLVSLEVIDLSGTGANSLTLASMDVIDLVGFNVFENTGTRQLVVKGDSDDQINLDGDWTSTANGVSLVGLAGQYSVFESDTSLAAVYVQEGVLVA